MRALARLALPAPSPAPSPSPQAGPRLPGRAAAWDSLGVPRQARLVVGWAGPLGLGSGVLDLIEAASICDEDVVVVIPAAGPAQRELLDHADARDLLHRVRFAAADPAAQGLRTLEAFPSMLAAVDALLVVPPRRRAGRRQFRAACAWARAHGVPLIGVGAAPDAAPGAASGADAPAWTVRPGDAGLLARLLTEIAAQPALLADAARAPVHPEAAAVPKPGRRARWRATFGRALSGT